MTQQAQVRLPEYRRGSLPDARSFLNDVISVIEADNKTRTMLRSDGVQWITIGDLLLVATNAEAILGLDAGKYITPASLFAVLASLGLTGGAGSNSYVDAGYVDAGYVS